MPPDPKGDALTSDLDSYVAGARERAEKRQLEIQELQRSLRARLPDAVEILRREFGVTQVVLFGSLARGEATERSDVDLLAYGLSLEKLLEASVCLDRVLRPFQVDLVPASRARPEVLERALAEGEVLYRSP